MQHHDVALIVLNQPVSFGTYVQPVCMHSGSPSVDNVHGDVAGWGQLRGTCNTSFLQFQIMCRVLSGVFLIFKFYRRWIPAK